MGTIHMNIAEFPISTLIKMVADLLESVIHTNDTILPTSTSTVTLFHSRAVPNIKIETYLARIQKYTPYTNEALLCILVFFDRISNLHPKFALSSLNIHRMLIASIVVASKFTSDIFYSNARYAKVGGLPLFELNKLEIDFLLLCDFELHVRLETLQEYGNQLLNHSIPPAALSGEDTLSAKSSKRKWDSSTNSTNSTNSTEVITSGPPPRVLHQYHHHPSQTHTHQQQQQQQQQHAHNSTLLPLTPPMNDREQELKRRRQHHSPILSLVSSENH